MIVIKEDSNQYKILLKQRVDFEFDFDEDSMAYDIDEALEKFNEYAYDIVNDRAFINDYMEEKAKYIKSIEFNIGNTFAEATIYLSSQMSKSDVEFYFDSFIEDVVSDIPNVSISIEGEVSYDDFDPSTEYGHVERSRYEETEGEVSIGTDGKVQIEYNK